MTTTEQGRQARLSIGDAITRLIPEGVPFRFTAYDGSSA